MDAVPRSRCWHRCSPALGAPRHSLLAGRGTDSGELRAPPPPSEPTRTERGRAPGEAGCAPREVRAAGVAARAAPGGRLHQDGTGTLQPRRRAAAAIRAVLRRAAGPSAAPRMVQDGAAATSGRASTLPRDEEHRPGAARRGEHGAGAPRNAARRARLCGQAAVRRGTAPVRCRLRQRRTARAAGATRARAGGQRGAAALPVRVRLRARGGGHDAHTRRTAALSPLGRRAARLPGAPPCAAPPRPAAPRPAPPRPAGL